MAKVVIIGAGLTGLSTAYHLEKKGFTDYLIVEKEAEVGGLCRSVKQDGFTFDFTGHLLHRNDPYFTLFLKELLDENNMIEHERRSFIYSHDIYTPYPFQINLHGLPSETIADCIEGYVNRKRSVRNPKSYAEWVLKFFGQGFANSFFFPYQRKLFQYDVKKLSSSWTGRFVPKTSLRQMLLGALKEQEKVGYNASFLYPKTGGIVYLVDQLSKKVRKPVIKNCAVVAIDLQKRIISFSNGRSEPFDILVSTMPLDQLLRMTKDRPSTGLSSASDKLLCTSVACLNLGISRKVGADKHWIYYPEMQYSFYRIGFYHNFSSHMAPPGCSSLYIECSYRKKSKPKVTNLIHSARSMVKNVLKLSEKDIVTEHVMRIPHAYVVYDFWRDRNLNKLHARLNQEGIYAIGRYGAWNYSSMQEAVLDGKKIAETIAILPARRIYAVETKKREKGRLPRTVVASSKN